MPKRNAQQPKQIARQLVDAKGFFVVRAKVGHSINPDAEEIVRTIAAVENKSVSRVKEEIITDWCMRRGFFERFRVARPIYRKPGVQYKRRRKAGGR